MPLTRLGKVVDQLIKAEQSAEDKGLTIKNVNFTKKNNLDEKKEQLIIAIDYEQGDF